MGGLRGEKGYYRLPSIFRAFSQINETTKEGVSVEFLFEENDKTSKGILRRLLALKFLYTEIKIAKLEKGADPNKISFNRFQPNMGDWVIKNTQNYLMKLTSFYCPIY